MTPLALWAAVALVALFATAFWLVLARDTGVFISSGLSFIAWAWLSLTGGDAGLVQGATTVLVRESVASLQYAALAMAVVSLLVFIMRIFGGYPPERFEQSDDQPDQSTNA